MRQVRSLTITFLLLSAPIWAQSPSKQTTLTADDVIRMIHSGQRTASIIEMIQNSARGFDVWSPNFTADMKQKGVPQVIINEMIENQIMYRDGPSLPAAMLRNLDVRDMLAAGTLASVIVEKIKDSPSNFDTSPAALGRLKRNGVPSSVVVAMIQASSGPRVLTDADYLAQFPSCSDFVNAVAASLNDSDWLDANLQAAMADVKRCMDDPDANASPRGPDATRAEVAKLLLVTFKKELNEYQQLQTQYNQLADQYNALRGAVIAQHFQSTFPPFVCTTANDSVVCEPY